MLLRLALIILIVSTSCTRQPVRVGLPAANPTGCYVTVYDRPEFRGVGDVLNGPGRWWSLERLLYTNEHSWRNRIRSLHVGATATVTAYTDAGFAGEKQQFNPNTKHPRLEKPFSARIESLELACKGGGGESH